MTLKDNLDKLSQKKLKKPF